MKDVSFSEEELRRVGDEIEKLDGDEEIEGAFGAGSDVLGGINERWGFMTRAARRLHVVARPQVGLHEKSHLFRQVAARAGAVGRARWRSTRTSTPHVCWEPS